jgi:hypothetical protein
MCCSLEGMFNFKPYVTDIMVDTNETMSSVSNGHYKGHILQKNDTSVCISLHDLNLVSLTKAIETKGAALSSKGKIIL